MKNLYLDQNVLGLIAEGKLNLRPKEPVRWVFSGEHPGKGVRFTFSAIASEPDPIPADPIPASSPRLLCAQPDHWGHVAPKPNRLGPRPVNAALDLIYALAHSI